MPIMLFLKKLVNFASEIVPNNILIHYFMETKIDFNQVDLGRMSIDYREIVLMSDITEVTPNGVWCKTIYGDNIFISNFELRLMAQFLLKITAYETESSNV